MLQTIITIIIVFAAGIIALTRLVSFFTNPMKKCGGCSQNCGGCSLEELKREIEEKKTQNSYL